MINIYKHDGNIYEVSYCTNSDILIHTNIYYTYLSNINKSIVTDLTILPLLKKSVEDKLAYKIYKNKSLIGFLYLNKCNIHIMNILLFYTYSETIPYIILLDYLYKPNMYYEILTRDFYMLDYLPLLNKLSLQYTRNRNLDYTRLNLLDTNGLLKYVGISNG